MLASPKICLEENVPRKRKGGNPDRIREWCDCIILHQGKRICAGVSILRTWIMVSLTWSMSFVTCSVGLGKRVSDECTVQN